MNQDNSNLNPNNFNAQGNNGMPNNQPLNSQNFNQGMGFNPQQINPQPQPTPSYQQSINQMNMQQPTPQPMNNTFESGNASNQSFNSKPPKKMNLGLIIGIVVAIVVIVGAVIFAFNNSADSSKSGSGTQSIQYSASNDQYIIEKIDVKGKNYINIPDGKGLLIVDNEGNIINIVSETKSFNIQSNDNNNYYYFSLLEHFVNIKSKIEKDNYVYNYNFRIKFKINDPVKMLEKISIKESIKATKIFEILFDEMLKGSLNDFIMDFVNKENISLDELGSSNINLYLLERLKSKSESEYNGVELMTINFENIQKTVIQQNNTSQNNKEYSIGDKIKFNNEYWYVIENSTKDTDYIVVLKERALDKKMKLLDDYEANLPYSSSHECFYEKSDIKKYLENEYIKTLGEKNLKEIAGYKIRLIKVEELCNNLVPNSENIDYYTIENSRGCYLYSEGNSNVAPEWTYLESIVGVDSYWTMSYSYGSGNYKVTDYVSRIGSYVGASVSGSFVSEMETEEGVRPVINLLKSSIQ